MMPICQGGLGQCEKTAVFLGPHEDPALCDQHFAELLDRVQKFFKKREKDPHAPKLNANFEIENVAELLDRVQKFFKKREKDPHAPKLNANFEIENGEIEGILNDMGKSIGSGLPDGWGFNLLIFTFGEGGSMFYERSRAYSTTWVNRNARIH